MITNNIKNSQIFTTPIQFLLYVLKWGFICLFIGFFIGGAIAFFLTSLDWVTNVREENLWIVALLPIAGLVIGLTYHYFGESVVKGNNLIIEEIASPQKAIPLKMAPLVLFGTLLTHLFGGSAGREGTAVQIGGAIADRFSILFKLSKLDRKALLIAGVSAGFSAVFGTPLAGAIFALEVAILGKIRLNTVFVSVMAAIFANYFCDIWNVSHTHYTVDSVVAMTPVTLFWALLSGAVFGLVAMLFSKSKQFWSNFFKNKVKYPPLRPFLGGVVLAILFYFIGTTKYLGLGIPTIVDAFHINLNSYDFILKLLFTSFTLGAGFKGGEVTPLFFIGATLGNMLVWFIPLPMDLLAGMGFVAVFAGATNTPIACTIMGIELFGIESGLFLAVACSTSYLFSGNTSVYSSQIIGKPNKHHLTPKG